MRLDDIWDLVRSVDFEMLEICFATPSESTRTVGGDPRMTLDEQPLRARLPGTGDGADGHQTWPSTPGDTLPRGRLRLTVVIPTRDEGPNAEPLLARLAPALAGFAADVLVVDDSDDETTVLSFRRAARAIGGCPSVLTIRRVGRDRRDSLAGAVLVGLQRAQGDCIVVMDGDLQHPPEIVPQLVHALQTSNADVAIASRYCPGTSSADSAGLNGPLRRIASRASGSIARVLFPRRLSGVTDPMSGCFAVRRASLPEESTIDARGFKILLAIILGAPNGLDVVEVPMRFDRRNAGETKANLRAAVAFLVQLGKARIVPA